jgi:hypothetical protein
MSSSGPYESQFCYPIAGFKSAPRLPQTRYIRHPTCLGVQKHGHLGRSVSD